MCLTVLNAQYKGCTPSLGHDLKTISPSDIVLNYCVVIMQVQLPCVGTKYKSVAGCIVIFHCVKHRKGFDNISYIINVDDNHCIQQYYSW